MVHVRCVNMVYDFRGFFILPKIAFFDVICCLTYMEGVTTLDNEDTGTI